MSCDGLFWVRLDKSDWIIFSLVSDIIIIDLFSRYLILRNGELIIMMCWNLGIID